MNNWQHTSTYPAFVLAGLVDFIGRVVPLPQGTGQGFTGLAFGVMTFLMATHKKPEPLDDMVHWLLFFAMALCMLAVALEMVARRNALLSIAKGSALVLLGAWLIQVGRIEFEEHPQWSPQYPGAAMFAPVAFCWIAVLVAACTLGLYCCLAFLQQAGLAYAPLPADAHEAAALAGAEGYEFENDSAHDESPRGKRGSSGASGVAPFQIVQGYDSV